MNSKRASRPTTPSPTRGHVLPDASHTALLRTRDHLQLLARLTTARILYDAAELELPAQSIAYSFQRLSADLDEVISSLSVRALR